jgi:hypothetical protein
MLKGFHAGTACRMPHLKRHANTYADKPIKVVRVNPNHLIGVINWVKGGRRVHLRVVGGLLQ